MDRPVKPRQTTPSPSSSIAGSLHAGGIDSTHSGSLPARTDSQFLAQLPELAEKLLNLSEEFEATAPAFCEVTQFSEALRGWSILEKIARESIHERAREALRVQAELARQTAQKQALQARPSVPRRTLQSGIRSKAIQTIQALDDPGVLNALKQWTQNQNSRKR